MTTVLCTAPRHAEPEPAEPGAYLCKPCRHHLRRDLLALPALHRDLGEVAARPYATTGDGPGMTASELQSQIRHDLVWWARLVMAESRATSCPVNTVLAIAAWLAARCQEGRHGWCAYQPWAPEMAGAFADVRAHAYAVVNPLPVIRFEIPGSVCPECGGGPLKALIYSDEADRRPSHLACLTCGVRLVPARWDRLDRAHAVFAPLAVGS